MKISSNALLASLIVLLLFTTPLFGETTEVYFSPETDILKLLLQQIDLTNESLSAAISSLDSGEIAQSLVKAKRRGVIVRLILDEENARENPSLISFFRDEGLEVILLRADAGGRMNNKFVLFDKRGLLTGSYNWTERSQRFNLESVVFTNQPDLIETYLQEFDRLAWLSKEAIVKKPPFKPAPAPTPLPSEPGKEFLDASFQELDGIFGEESKLTSRGKKQAWEKYEGKYVQWQGILVYKGVGRMDWNKVGISHDEGKEADVEVSFNWTNMQTILSLKEGDLITYTARLSSRRGRSSPYRLEDGEVLEQK